MALRLQSGGSDFTHGEKPRLGRGVTSRTPLDLAHPSRCIVTPKFRCLRCLCGSSSPALPNLKKLGEYHCLLILSQFGVFLNVIHTLGQTILCDLQHLGIL